MNGATIETMTSRPAVGLPQALLYYEHGPVWRECLELLGAAVVGSGPTSRAIVDRGVAAAIDEACLPVKVAYGHCLALAERVDALFVPRVVSIERKAYSCPKLLGLPDMVRLALPRRITVLSPTIDLSRGPRRLAPALAATARWIGADRAALRRAARCLEAGLSPAEPAGSSASAGSGKVKIGVLGHSYNVLDDGLNLGLRRRLAALGAEVVTGEDYAAADLARAVDRSLTKPLFWSLGRRLIGAARLMAEDPALAGIVAVASFGCGPDSMVVDLAMRLVGRLRPELPFMELTLDEHTGEAGLVTRLEAFYDLAYRRLVG